MWIVGRGGGRAPRSPRNSTVSMRTFAETLAEFDEIWEKFELS